jgi:hypothetical protein
MRKAVIGTMAVMALALLAWASNDPWKAKPYDQWDQKDVQKVLNNSPWTRVVTVDASWQGNGSMSMPQSGAPQSPSSSGSSSSSSGGRPGMGGGGGGGSAPPSGGGAPMSAGGGGGTPQAQFVVRWLSSRTMREAFVRSAELDGRIKPEDAQKQVSETPDAYQVIIAGPQMEPFDSVEEAAIKEKAFLEPKKSKERIAASKVEFQRSPDGKSVRAVVIAFPKTTASGQATIAPDDKGAEFSLGVGKTIIKTSFDFSKMYDAQGRDL